MSLELSLGGGFGSGHAVSYRFTAAPGQTVFSGLDANGMGLAYVVGNTIVFRNNVELSSGSFTATTSTSITLSTPCTGGENIVVVTFGLLSVKAVPLKATSIQAVEGSDDTTFMTPAKTADAIAKLTVQASSSAASDVSAYPTNAYVRVNPVPPIVQQFRTGGYSEPGDGGGALYRRVLSAPSHVGRLQSSDGAWWEIVPDDTLSPAMFGGSIQDAIDVAFTLNCREVRLRGVYTLTASVIMRPGVWLKATPGVEAVITVPNGSTLVYLINFASFTPHGSGLDGITLDGNRANRTDNPNTFLIYGENAVEEVTVRNCRLVNSTGFGLYFRDFVRAKVINNVCDNLFVAGIYLQGSIGSNSIRHLIQGNRVTRFGQHGIVTWNTRWSRVEKNECYGTGVAGTVVNISGNKVTWVSGPNFADILPGSFVIGNHAGGFFEANIIAKESNTSLTVNYSVGTYSNVPVNLGNGDVISISGSSDEVIFGNLVRGGASLGISLFSTPDNSCDRCLVEQNQVYSTLASGYSIQSAANQNRDNIIRGNLAVDTGIGGAGAAIDYRTGLTLAGSTTRRTVVEGNTWISYGAGMLWGFSILADVPEALVGDNKSLGLFEGILNGQTVSLQSGWGNATITAQETYGNRAYVEVTLGSTPPSSNPVISMFHRARPLRRKRATAIMTATGNNVLPVVTAAPEGDHSTSFVVIGTPGGGAGSVTSFVISL